MAGQLVVLHWGLAVRAVDHIQQGGVLHLQTFICLDGLQTNAVGGVGVAVLVHHLLGITVGSGKLLCSQLTAQRLEAGIHSGQRFQRFLRFLGHIVAHNCGLAAVRVGGEGLFQEGFYVGGVLIGAGQLCRLLVSTVLCQPVQVRRSAREVSFSWQCSYDVYFCSAEARISAIALRMLCSSSSGFSSGCSVTER